MSPLAHNRDRFSVIGPNKLNYVIGAHQSYGPSSNTVSFVVGTICILSAVILLKFQPFESYKSNVPKLSVALGVESIESVQFNKGTPNIVFILADDLGHNDVGFSYVAGGQHSKIETPRIDSLAKRYGSVILDQCYSMPMCTPSRAAIMTGLHPIHSGLQHFVIISSQPTGLPLGIRTLPQELKKRFGYRTHLVGKWHLGFAHKEYLPTNRGFDSFYGYVNGAEDYWTHDTTEMLIGQKAVNRGSTPGHLGHDWFRDEKPMGRSRVDGQHGSTLITKEALGVIGRHAQLLTPSSSPQVVAGAEEQLSGPPLFLFVASQAPHLHFTGAPSDMYARVDSTRATTMSTDSSQADPNVEVDWISRREVAALVSCVDSLVGQVEDALIEAGMWENTLLVFSSDNGPEGGGGRGGNVAGAASAHPYRGRKRTVWEGGIRALTFMHSRKLLSLSNENHFSENSGGSYRQARVYNGLFHFVDWTPTLLHAAAFASSSSSSSLSSSFDSNSDVGETSFSWNAHGDDPSSEGSSNRKRIESNGISSWNEIQQGLEQSARNEMLLQYDQVAQCAALRRNNYKVVWNGDCGNPSPVFGSWEIATNGDGYGDGYGDGWQLFDILTDPSETNDLSKNQAYEEIFLSMKKSLEDHGTTALPALSYITQGDENASPVHHNGYWVSWLADAA